MMDGSGLLSICSECHGVISRDGSCRCSRAGQGPGESEVGQLRASLAAATRRAEGAEATCAAMREALRSVEWVEDTGLDGNHYCPSCGVARDTMHALDCKLALAYEPDAGKRVLAVVEAARTALDEIRTARRRVADLRDCMAPEWERSDGDLDSAECRLDAALAALRGQS